MTNRLPNDSHDNDHDKSLPDVLADLQARQRLSRRNALRRLGGAGLILSPLGAMAAVGCGEAVDGETIFSGGTTVSSGTRRVRARADTLGRLSPASSTPPRKRRRLAIPG